MFVGYFPQDGLMFLIIGALCTALFGILFGMFREVKSFKGLFVLFLVTIGLIASSVAFDHPYLREFEENGETYPEPLFGCSGLQKHIEERTGTATPLEFNTWESFIKQPECRTGVLATISISYLFAWSSVFFLFYFFSAAFRLVKNQFQASVKQHVEENRDTKTKPPSTVQFQAPVKQDAEEHCKTEPPNTDENQDIPFEYTYASLDEDAIALIDCICDQISTKKNNKASPGWDGEIFRNFVLHGFKHYPQREEKFQKGFKEKGEQGGQHEKVNYLWSSFSALGSRGLANKTAIRILEWRAACTETPLRTLLGEFIVYYEKNGKNRAEFFENIKPIAEKIKSELK